jgi:RNA polymerase sigma-70 factor, ECF subfamily
MKDQPHSMSLEDVIKRHERMIYALAASIAANREDTEDIMQNVIFHISRNIPAIRKSQDISRWIYKTTYNEAVAYLRRKQGQIRTFSTADRRPGKPYPWIIVNQSKMPVQELLDDDLKDRIDTVIKDLPIEFRMPLLLHHIGGVSLDDSSKILGLSVTTVKKRLYRAYTMMRAEIADYFNDGEAQERKTPRSPECGMWRPFIYDYAEGDLSEKRKEAFRRHIKDCPRCSLFLDAYKRAIRITGALECQDVGPELQGKIETFLSHAYA